MSHVHGVDSEAGTLRTVLVHRPGRELQRITQRTRDRLLLGSLPWLEGIRREHDALTRALRDQGTEVIYVTELLQDVLEYQAARDEAIRAAVRPAVLGAGLAAQVTAWLDALSPEDLAQALIAGLTADELPGGRGLAFQLLGRSGFVLDPLPNLVFTRDSSFWIGDRSGVASPADPRRRRESALIALIYAHHPRFAGHKSVYGPGREPVDGGDVLLLGPGVLAVGVGQRTTAAGAERLAGQALDAGLAHTVLAIPVDQAASTGYLDTICAVLDAGTVLMQPAVAFTLTAHILTAHPAGTRVSRPQPFLEAAARALGIGKLAVIDPGPDDGGNVLAVGPRLAVCHERSSRVIGRLEAAGMTVVRVPGSELASCRGGPRAMVCPLSRDPAAEGEPEVAAPDTGLYQPAPLPVAAATAVSPAVPPARLAPAGA